MRKIDEIIIHTSFTPRTCSQRDTYDFIHDNIHKYHYFIIDNGFLERGAVPEKLVHHCKGHDKNSLSICLIGGVKSDGKTPVNNFTKKQMEELERILIYFYSLYGDISVYGYNDFYNKRKRCFDFQSWWYLKKATFEIEKEVEEPENLLSGFKRWVKNVFKI